MSWAKTIFGKLVSCFEFTFCKLFGHCHCFTTRHKFVKIVWQWQTVSGCELRIQLAQIDLQPRKLVRAKGILLVNWLWSCSRFTVWKLFCLLNQRYYDGLFVSMKNSQIYFTIRVQVDHGVSTNLRFVSLGANCKWRRTNRYDCDRGTGAMPMAVTILLFFVTKVNGRQKTLFSSIKSQIFVQIRWIFFKKKHFFPKI